MATLLLSVLLPMMDSFIVNVALPTIGADLRAESHLELVVAGYGIGFAATLILGGQLGDRFGRRRLLLIGLTMFVIASMLCALAPGIGWLIAARVLQGASGAMIPPQALGTIGALVPADRKQRVLTLYSATSGVAAILGLIIGGALVAADLWGSSWRLVFLVNIPLGVIALVGAWITVPPSASGDSSAIDGLGAVLLVLGAVTLLIPLSQAQSAGMPWWAFASIAVSIAVFAALWSVESRLPQATVAILPPQLLTLRPVRHGLAVLVPFLAVWAGFLVALPLTLQAGFALGPLTAGLVVAPMSAAFLAGSFAVPRLRDIFGDRVPAVGGVVQALGIAALAGAVLSQRVDEYPWLPIPGLALIGLGQAFVIGATTISVLADIPANLAGRGGGVLVTAQQGSMALGAATLGAYYTRSAPESGSATAFSVVLAVQFVVVVVIALVSATRSARRETLVGD
ncbi:MFS transporter [Nocardia sp. CDC159]|uniref:MFS transporter n=1 Tax=Nocardia pulmonis TaxID=2951408 RepID=A0A9X2IWA8_9NOCA|nr:MULTISPECIES: MFS transporter [Nocardia]MCM6772645.1 MFS transporter [Nocardia pulmonis]MCM6786052.1 MFS transporter [Nocardia sp. CDC159]